MADLRAVQELRMKELEKLQSMEKDYMKARQAREKLDVQLNENKIVLEELNLAEEGANVFKLVGPALVKQDANEARMNVSKRIDYITAELSRQEKLMEGLQPKLKHQVDLLNSLEARLTQLGPKGDA